MLNAYAIYIFRLVGAQKNNNVYLIKVFVQIYLKKWEWSMVYSLLRGLFCRSSVPTDPAKLLMFYVRHGKVRVGE